MMQLKVELDAKSLLLRLKNGEKRLAYATVAALNTAGERLQQDEFANVRSKFNVRATQFFFGTPARPGGVAAKLYKANIGKDRPFAELAVGQEATLSRAGVMKKRVLLPMFETGGRYTSQFAKTVAVPITGGARPRKGADIDPRFTFSAMALKAYEEGKAVKAPGRNKYRTVGVFGEYGRLQPPEAGASKRVYKGRFGTFIVKASPSLPWGGVMQRSSQFKGAVRLLWKFQPSVPVDARLAFRPLVSGKFPAYFKAAFDDETKKTLTYHGYRFVA